MKSIAIASSVVVTILVSYLLVSSVVKSKKIGVVQMDKLVYEYQGMKEATKKYENKVIAWQRISDSLENNLRNIYSEIRLDSIKNNKAKLQEDIRLFSYLKDNYENYVQNSGSKAQEIDEKLTIGIVNQLNDYIKAYAKEHNYDVILTNTQNQSVGFVTENVDVTEEVLTFANKKYSGI